MENNWQRIWNNRDVDLEKLNSEDEQTLILELKKAVGFDAYGRGSKLTFAGFLGQYETLKKNLRLSQTGGTIFEVGCGNGAFLYFFKKDGFKVGGLDYAENMLEIARKVIGDKNLVECICASADKIPTQIKYDAVFSSGVFAYFDDVNYAEKVLDLMVAKAKKSVAVLEVFDEELKEKYLAYRRKEDKNYDEHYKGLSRLYLSREFFVQYAAKNNLELKFEKCGLENYWNAPFIFECYLYKK